jgi:methylenetetrahydrofolate reductase (NADPH)
MRDGSASGVTVAGLLARPRYELIPMAGVEEQASFLPAGATVTVTCSPRRGVEATLELCERLRGFEFHVVPHLAARVIRSREHLAETLARAREDGLDEAFLIGGDSAAPAGPYAGAAELLREMNELGHPFREIGVGAYPDTHPLIDASRLMDALLEKQPMATYVVTQMCFDARTIQGWLTEARRRGVTLPVRIGIPGVLKRRKLIEIALRVGVGDSTRYITKHAGIVARLMRRGDFRPDPLVARLAAVLDDPGNRVRGFHINTFNQVESTERWRRDVLETHQWRGGTAGAEEHDEDAAS